MKKINNILTFRILPQPKIKNWVIGVVACISFVFSVTLIVPTDYSNIQAGIDASVDGDTVLVLDGVYSGEGNYDIFISEPYGREILLISESGPENCIIDCQFLGRGFNIQGTNYLVLKGFTIIRGIAEHGGGIYIMSTPYLYPKVENCIIRDNIATNGGGGILTFLSYPVFNKCIIINNSASYGSGLEVANWSSPTFRNSIFLDNYSVGAEWPPNFTYSCLNFEFYNDEFNNITTDPLFVNPEENNFQLNLESPLINVGDPESQLDPDSTIADIGPFYFHLEFKGDANFDTEINILDIVLTVNVIIELLEPFNAQVWAMDMNSDDVIDILDIILIVNLILEA